MSGGIIPEKPALVFRLNDNGQGPELLRQVFLEQGWNEHDEELHEEHDWNMWWRTSRFRTGDYDNIYPWQRLNHYPKSTAITKKDALARNLKRMRCVHGGNVFNFSPLSFNLPNDYTKFVKTYSTLRQKPEGKVPLWICKPADLSRGRGIFIFRDLSELLYDFNAVIQQYVDNPLLIGGYKFDLRIYVAVTSFHPLTVYIHEEGIARFGTEKFDLNSTKNVFAHLTNTSINKHSPGYTLDKERVGPGCKWTLSQLRHYFLANNIDDRMLWKRIVNIVVLTLLIQAPQVPKTENCFELYGFDILIDENVKPWLLEVNFSPSLSSDCLADVLAKKPMLHDLLTLMNFSNQDVERGGADFSPHKKTNSRSQTQMRGSMSGPSRMSLSNRKNSQGRDLGVPGGRDRSTSVLGLSPRIQQTASDLPSGMGLPLAEPTFVQNDISDEHFALLGYQSSTEVTPRQYCERGWQSGYGSKVSLTDDTKLMPASLSCTPSNGPQKLLQARKLSLDLSTPAAADRQVNVDSLLDQIICGTLGKKQNSADFDYSLPKAPAPGKLHSTTVSAESKFSTGSDDSKTSSLSLDTKASKASTDSGFSSSKGETASSNTAKSTGHLRARSRNKNNSSLAHSAQNSSDTYISRQMIPLPAMDRNRKDRISLRSRSTVPPPRKENQVCVRKYLHTGVLTHAAPLSNSMSSLHTLGGDDDYNPMTTRSYISVNSETAAELKRRNQRAAGSLGQPSFVRGSKSSLSQYSRSHRPQHNKSNTVTSLSHLPKKVGGFYLVFPFNEATWKTAVTNLEAKVVIRETQLLLKESLTAVSGSKAGIGQDDSRQVSLTELWGPLRPPKEDS